MMTRTRITETRHPLFSRAWELYESAFPADERRTLHPQSKVLERAAYHFEVVTDNDAFVGLLLWWHFNDVRYVEHLATLPGLRGKGYGKQVLETFVAESDVPVWLEVEPPTDEMKRRRVGFYQRVGFALNTHHYMQPPYTEGGSPVPLLLMTHPITVTEAAVRDFCRTYHPVLTDYT